MLTVFRGATAINDGTTAEPLRPWRCNYGLCRTSTAVAPRLRCDGGRRSAVMTILRDATATNDGTTAIMAVSLRNHGDNGGATAVYAVQAPQWYRASGVTGVVGACVYTIIYILLSQLSMERVLAALIFAALIFAARVNNSNADNPFP